MRKPGFFCICENKEQISFATRIVHFLFYLNPKFQVSSHLLWLYSPVCVGPGRKPRRPVFSQRGSNNKRNHTLISHPYFFILTVLPNRTVYPPYLFWMAHRLCFSTLHHLQTISFFPYYIALKHL